MCNDNGFPPHFPSKPALFHLDLGTYGLPIPGGGEGLKTAICSIITCISQIPTKSYILFFASLKIFTFTFDFEISASIFWPKFQAEFQICMYQLTKFSFFQNFGFDFSA